LREKHFFFERSEKELAGYFVAWRRRTWYALNHKKKPFVSLALRECSQSNMNSRGRTERAEIDVSCQAMEGRAPN
jgi:hypothetical protein